MGHYPIIQLSKFDNEDAITTEDFKNNGKYSWFINDGHADFVHYAHSPDDVENLFEYALNRSGIQYDKEKRTVTIIDKEEYFKRKYERFIETAKSISDWSLKHFVDGNIDTEMYRLNTSVEDKVDTYICIDDRIQSMDAFIRGCNNGESYKVIFGIMYHI